MSNCDITWSSAGTAGDKQRSHAREGWTLEDKCYYLGPHNTVILGEEPITSVHIFVFFLLNYSKDEFAYSHIRADQMLSDHYSNWLVHV